MIRTWDKYWGKEKFVKRIHKGIPDRFRGTVWARLLFLEQMKEQQKGKYEVREVLKLLYAVCVYVFISSFPFAS